MILPHPIDIITAGYTPEEVASYLEHRSPCPPFGPEGACPKCWYNYQRGDAKTCRPKSGAALGACVIMSREAREKEGVAGEHLHWRCVCGHEVLTLCYDAPRSAAPDAP